MSANVIDTPTLSPESLTVALGIRAIDVKMLVGFLVTVVEEPASDTRDQIVSALACALAGATRTPGNARELAKAACGDDLLVCAAGFVNDLAARVIALDEGMSNAH